MVQNSWFFEWSVIHALNGKLIVAIQMVKIWVTKWCVVIELSISNYQNTKLVKYCYSDKLAIWMLAIQIPTVSDFLSIIQISNWNINISVCYSNHLNNELQWGSE